MLGRSNMKIAMIVAALVAFALPAAAQMNMPMPAPAAGAPTTGTVLGEIRIIDRDSNKLTVAHEPIAEFNMRAMTMVIQATAPQLDGLAVGDRIRAVVVRNGA